MSTTFNMTSDQLVTAALRKLAVLGDGQSPSTSQLANGTQALNVMLKTFQVKGMPLWAIADYDLSLAPANTYTLGIPTPLKVIQGLLVEPDGTTREITQKTRIDFNNLSPAVGTPNAFWYESGILKVWPTPEDTSRKLRIVYQRPINDMLGGTDTLDFPQYWLEAVIYGLAHRLSPEYGIPLQDRSQLGQEAQLFLNEALSFGTEEGSFFIRPDWTTK